MMMRLLAIGVVFSGVLIPCLADAQTVQGFGKNVPFSTAARQIVPSDITVDVDRRVMDGKVNWTGGSDWHAVLDQVAASHNAAVSYNGQSVRITPAGATEQVQGTMPSLSRAGLVVLSEQPVVVPVQIAPSAPIVLAPVATIPATGPMPILLTPNTAQAAPIVLSPEGRTRIAQQNQEQARVMTPVTAPKSGVVAVTVPVAVVVPKPATVVVEPVVVVKEVRETPRQRVERLRAERAVEREANTGTDQTRVPAIRNAQPSSRQPSAAGVWRATRGESLEQVVGDWADKAKWTFVPSSQVIYDIQADAEFTGSFTEAVAALVRSVRARPVPTVVFYRNNVVVISNNIDGN